MCCADHHCRVHRRRDERRDVVDETVQSSSTRIGEIFWNDITEYTTLGDEAKAVEDGVENNHQPEDDEVCREEHEHGGKHEVEERRKDDCLSSSAFFSSETPENKTDERKTGSDNHRSTNHLR